MVRVHKSKTRRFRGSRSHGRGNTKKGRGSGNRGGVGRGGARAQKKTRTVKYEKDFYGVHGFVNPTRRKIKTINLSEISRKISNGEIGKKDNVFYFRFNGKVLGAGQLDYPAIIEARSFSRNAVDKIEEVGGEARTI